MEAPRSSLLAVAVPGIPQATTKDDVPALISPALNTLVWPDRAVGVAQGDIIVIARKLVAICEGRLVKEGTAKEDALSEGNSPRGISVLPPEDPRTSAREIRRGLDARFGGRPGVIITGPGELLSAAGIDSTIGSADLRRSLAATAKVLMNAYPDHPVVAIRGLGHLLTYEDQD
ncbi:coenzyme F420-0:L-glutamate ligase [Flaviflexus sp.]|uniref:coenzyme F420-0:L-glutamate ligase n=1 Tax=Flaviflexus sp. TaxID=1969482 RepID=UPI003F925D8A